ncbi:hypothetical protein C9I98_03625 [Photobacterium sanctipauli]|uniref:Uncharacterized protein n=1 Tax=Photobacterium sanctipauli TaxID=1342794 RepID=A0A2T3NXN7_9GAMM|nr:hypothetical protein C9I98_03625 [Photobacterium sanctipauli]
MFSNNSWLTYLFTFTMVPVLKLGVENHTGKKLRGDITFIGIWVWFFLASAKDLDGLGRL